jgi:hypothetical protein
MCNIPVGQSILPLDVVMNVFFQEQSHQKQGGPDKGI